MSQAKQEGDALQDIKEGYLEQSDTSTHKDLWRTLVLLQGLLSAARSACSEA